MNKGTLDLFDLKRIQISHNKKELIKLGEKLQQKVSSDDLATFVPVHRDPLALISLTESKMIEELLGPAPSADGR